MTRRRSARALISAAAASTLLLTVVLVHRSPDRRATCSGSLIPAYLPPGEFAQLASAQLLIVNPASGPGASPDPTWRAAIERARARGARVIGYVATTFGARAPADVLADAARYRDWYGVDGIFLDEVAHDDARLPYYRALSRDLHARFLVLNPGTVPTRGYFALANVVVTFEGPYASYAAWRAPEWLDALRAQSAHLIYAASRAQARSLFAAPRRAGYVYVTAGTPPDPWGAPPPYLREEQGACPTPSQ